MAHSDESPDALDRIMRKLDLTNNPEPAPKTKRQKVARAAQITAIAKSKPPFEP